MQTELALIAYKWIMRLPDGTRFSPSDIYRFLAAEHSDKVKQHSTREKEPRHQYDARWAIQTAKANGLLTHVSRNVWERNPSLAVDVDLFNDAG